MALNVVIYPFISNNFSGVQKAGGALDIVIAFIACYCAALEFERRARVFVIALTKSHSEEGCPG